MAHYSTALSDWKGAGLELPIFEESTYISLIEWDGTYSDKTLENSFSIRESQGRIFLLPWQLLDGLHSVENEDARHTSPSLESI